MIEKLPRSTLQTRTSQAPLVKADANGEIKKGGNSVITLSINGQTIEIPSGNGIAQSKQPGSGLARSSQLIEAQLQRDNIYCRTN